MLERMRRTIVALGLMIAVIIAALAFSTPAEASTNSVVHRVWVSVDSLTSSTADDSLTVPTNSSTAAAFVAKLNAYWNRETGGAVTLQLGGFETRLLSSTCSASGLFVAGRSADFGGMFASTEDWTGTDNHLLAMSRESCTSADVGQGSVGGAGGTMSTLAGSGDSLGLPVAAHEFGHNLGFLHANVDSCPTGTDSGSSCVTTAYADSLDVMGSAVAGSLPHESTPQLISLGYLTAFVSLSQSTGIVQQTLQPVGAASGTRALRITDPSTGEQYFVEYRIADSADAASPEFSPNYTCTTAANGLARCWGGMSAVTGGIRVLRFGADGTSVMAIGIHNSTHLDAGQTFENHDGAFKLIVTSLSPTNGAVISVAFGASSIAQIGAPISSVAAASPTIASTTVQATNTETSASAALTKTTVRARLRHSTIARRTRPVVIAVVSGASRPTGTLSVWANGKRMRSVPLRATDHGKRVITLPRHTEAGTIAIRVTYSGTSKLTRASSTLRRLTVR